MPADVARWLERLGLEKYAPSFAENAIEFDYLPDLTEADLKDLGVRALGDRKKLLRAAAALSEDAGLHRAAAAERRQLTVMFCDLVGSTEIAARHDPEDVAALMRDYQQSCDAIITGVDGFVAQYLGDGILAYFGYPWAHENDAERAVRAGLQIVQALADRTVSPTSGPPIRLRVRIGIATGLVVVGQGIRADASVDPHAVGETPNLAARLLTVAQPDEVMISDLTRRLIGDGFQLVDAGQHQFKGLVDPVRVWRVAGEREPDDGDLSAPDDRPALLGRDAEIGRLTQLWDKARGGHGQSVLVCGEPGVGKSALAGMLVPRAREDGGSVVTIRCSPFHANSALQPVIGRLRRVLGSGRTGAADSIEALEALVTQAGLECREAVPLLAGLLSIALPDGRYPSSELPPPQQKQLIDLALLAIFEARARERPTILVWEDLHWADPSTLDLLEQVIDRSGSLPVLHVMTFRPGFVPPWHPGTTPPVIQLARLLRPQVEALIGRHAGGVELPADVVDHIVAKADGVPLYVEELTRAILESDFLKRDGNRYLLTRSLAEASIPATLQESLTARLDRLPEIRRVAQLGAVFGRTFSYEMVEKVAPVAPQELRAALDHLVEADLLQRQGEPHQEAYVFRHALVQDAAYQSLLKQTRQDYHRQIAEVLERSFREQGDRQPELLAYHFSEAGLAGRALNYWYRAGQQAIARFANPEAVEYLRRGLDALDGVSESPERDRLELAFQVALGPSLMATRGYGAPEVGEAYERARHLCSTVGEASQLFTVIWGLRSHRLLRAEHHAALTMSKEFLVLGRTLPEIECEVTALGSLGMSLFYVGELTEARAHFEKGIELYEPRSYAEWAGRHGGHDVGVYGYPYLSLVLWLLGDVAAALRCAQQARDLIRQQDNDYGLARLLYWDALLRQFNGDWKAMRSAANEARALASRHGFKLVHAGASILLGWSEVRQGEALIGDRLIRDGLTAYRATGARMQLPHFQIPVAEAALALGRPRDGLAAMDQALATINRTGERYMAAECHRLRGELLQVCEPDRPGPVEAELRQALAVARGQRARSLELRAAISLSRFCLAHGRPDEVTELLAPLLAQFSEVAVMPDLASGEALLAIARQRERSDSASRAYSQGRI